MQSTPDVSLYPGSLFRQPRPNTTITPLLEGTLKGLPYVFFDYTTPNLYDNTKLDSRDVIEVTLPHKFPHIIIDSKVEDEFESALLTNYIDKKQIIELEGDFSRFFTLYAPDKFGIEALTILAPDVMLSLLKHAGKCDIEIVDNKMYFYWRKSTQVSSEQTKKLATAERIVEELHRKLKFGKLLPLLDSYSNSLRHNTGKRLKRNKNGDTKIFGTLFVVSCLTALYLSSNFDEFTSWFLVFFFFSIICYEIFSKNLHSARKEKHASRYVEPKNQ